MVTTRPFEKQYLSDTLRLIEKSDSTNRSIDTWCGNDMTAVLAFDKKKLIGVLPLEKRMFSIGEGRNLGVLWISGAHVEPAYRNQGIGTAMDRDVHKYFYPEYKAILAYRGDETSSAYKWYKKMEYHDVLSVLSYEKSVTPVDIRKECVLWKTEADIVEWEDKIYDCFNHNVNDSGGFTVRHRKFWSQKLKNHYYKDSYKYSILASIHQNEILGYAFLGQTAIRDGIPRIDVLELITPEDTIIKDHLYKAIIDLASKNRLDKIRIELSVQDHNLKWIKSLGFVNRRRSNILGKLIDPIEYFRDCLSVSLNQTKGYKFVLQTSLRGEHTIGTGEKYIKLFAQDSLLNQILLCRSNISNAIEEGRLVIVDGDENIINDFEGIFPLIKWRYFHIDYI